MSLQTITEINLDINQPGVAVVHAKQYDTVRQVKAHLFYNGVKWLVPSSNFEAVVGFKKADRIGGFYDETESGETAITVDGSDRSIIYILLDRNVVTTPGNVNTEITFYDSITTGRLSTFSFITQVEEATVTELDLTSSPYFNILAEDIKKVIESADAMTGLSATVSRLAPDTNPTVTVTGGTSEQDPFVFHFGMPSMTTITANAIRLAPGALPSATMSGGQTAGEAFNVEFGVPSMPGITAHAGSLPTGATPTVTVTGGQTAGQPFDFTFGIPKGDPGETADITSISYDYILSISGTSIPQSGWVNDPSQLGPSDAWRGKFLWSRTIVNWDNGESEYHYSVAYNGMDGTGSVTSVNGRDGNVTIAISDFFDYVAPI